jgi:hypothetical protein
MKSLKKLAIVGAIVLALTVTTVTAFAASYSSPADIIAGLTGESADSIRAEKVESDSTYGTIADSYGVLEAFEEQMLEQKEAWLQERVASGSMTQEQADAIIAAMEENQANCDGSCDGSEGGLLAGMGARFGGMGQSSGSGLGDGLGSGVGSGLGNGVGQFGGVGGTGSSLGLRDASCIA